jgi:site-specific recombinase XerD
MPTSLLLFAPPAPAPLALAKRVTLEELVALANDYAADVHAKATRRAYLSDFRAFEAWCGRRGLSALPATAGTVAVYLAALANDGKRPSTIQRALAGIAHEHRARGALWPRGASSIGQVMSGIRRRHGTAPAQKAPLGDDDLAALVGTLGEGLRGHRDRALLTLGWMGAFRRSELVALCVEDVTRVPEGLVVRVRQSKGDPEGRGGEKGIPCSSRESLCAVRALSAWLEAAAITSGPVFRAVDRFGRVHEGALGDGSVARIVQRAAAAAGLDPTTVAGHSLRAGFATTAAKNGKSLDAIMRQTLHRSERVARSYVRHAGVFDDNAGFGLL